MKTRLIASLLLALLALPSAFSAAPAGRPVAKPAAALKVTEQWPVKYECSEFGEESGLVRYRLSNGKWGVKTVTGAKVLPPEYDRIDYCLLQRTYLIFEKGSRQGMADYTGRILIQPVYDTIEPLLTDNKAFKVRQGQKFGVVDTSGNVRAPVQYDVIGEPHLVNPNEIPDDPIPACVQEGISCGYLQSAGDWQILIPMQYTKVNAFAEGLAGVCQAGKCGYINTRGETVIPFRYTQVGGFENGQARVEFGVRQDEEDDGSNGYYVDTGLIDTEGNIIERQEIYHSRWSDISG